MKFCSICALRRGRNTRRIKELALRFISVINRGEGAPPSLSRPQPQVRVGEVPTPRKTEGYF